MDLSTIFAERAELELDLGKLGKINTEYDPQFYTPCLEKQIQNETTEGKMKTQWLVSTIHGLVKKWDLTADTPELAELFGVQVGEVVPLTKEALSNLPAGFLAAVFNAFTNAPKNATSSETSDSS